MRTRANRYGSGQRARRGSQEGAVTRRELLSELVTLGSQLDRMALRQGPYSESRTQLFMKLADREGELLHMLYEVTPVA